MNIENKLSEEMYELYKEALQNERNRSGRKRKPKSIASAILYHKSNKSYEEAGKEFGVHSSTVSHTHKTLESSGILGDEN